MYSYPDEDMVLFYFRHMAFEYGLSPVGESPVAEQLFAQAMGWV